MSKTINVGLVGFGISAKVFHAPFLKASPHYNVTAVLERHKEESKALFPGAQVVRSLDDLLRTDIDLAIITTPNDTHFPYTQQSLHAGKHVVLEKPSTIYSNETLQLAALARQVDRKLIVYHNRRYVSDYLTIKDILSKGLLGEVHTYDTHYNRYRAEARPAAWREKPEPGSGILYDLSPHLLDQCLCLFGVPKYITADVRKQRPHAQTDDRFTITLDYGHLQATLNSGMLVREPGPRFMIHGTAGSFIKWGEDPQEAKLRAGEPLSADLGKEPEEIWGLLHTEINGQVIKEIVPSHIGNYGQFYEDVYQSLAFAAPLPVKPEQAYNVIRLIELALESSNKKCTLPCEGLIEAY